VVGGALLTTIQLQIRAAAPRQRTRDAFAAKRKQGVRLGRAASRSEPSPPTSTQQTAVPGTLAIIHRREDEAVRAALERVEAALVNSPEDAMKIIRDELARLDRLGAEVDHTLRDLDGR
jgi:hypothetical protein